MFQMLKETVDSQGPWTGRFKNSGLCEASQEDKETFKNVSTAYDYYRLFQPEIWASEVLYQSKLYAGQKQFSKKVQDNISFDVYRCTEAMMLHSGYNNIPCRKMMWEQKMDCHNVLVSEAMRRDEAESFFQRSCSWSEFLYLFILHKRIIIPQLRYIPPNEFSTYQAFF